MNDFKNASLDSLSIGAIGTGIELIPTHLLSGVILVLVGSGLSVLKYHLRTK